MKCVGVTVAKEANAMRHQIAFVGIYPVVQLGLGKDPTDQFQVQPHPALNYSIRRETMVRMCSPGGIVSYGYACRCPSLPLQRRHGEDCILFHKYFQSGGTRR